MTGTYQTLALTGINELLGDNTILITDCASNMHNRLVPETGA